MSRLRHSDPPRPAALLAAGYENSFEIGERSPQGTTGLSPEPKRPRAHSGSFSATAEGACSSAAAQQSHLTGRQLEVVAQLKELGRRCEALALPMEILRLEGKGAFFRGADLIPTRVEIYAHVRPDRVLRELDFDALCLAARNERSRRKSAVMSNFIANAAAASNDNSDGGSVGTGAMPWELLMSCDVESFRDHDGFAPADACEPLGTVADGLEWALRARHQWRRGLSSFSSVPKVEITRLNDQLEGLKSHEAARTSETGGGQRKSWSLLLPRPQPPLQQPQPAGNDARRDAMSSSGSPTSELGDSVDSSPLVSSDSAGSSNCCDDGDSVSPSGFALRGFGSLAAGRYLNGNGGGSGGGNGQRRKSSTLWSFAGTVDDNERHNDLSGCGISDAGTEFGDTESHGAEEEMERLGEDHGAATARSGISSYGGSEPEGNDASCRAQPDGTIDFGDLMSAESDDEEADADSVFPDAFGRKEDGGRIGSAENDRLSEGGLKGRDSSSTVLLAWSPDAENGEAPLEAAAAAAAAAASNSEKHLGSAQPAVPTQQQTSAAAQAEEPDHVSSLQLRAVRRWGSMLSWEALSDGDDFLVDLASKLLGQGLPLLGLHLCKDEALTVFSEGGGARGSWSNGRSLPAECAGRAFLLWAPECRDVEANLARFLTPCVLGASRRKFAAMCRRRASLLSDCASILRLALHEMLRGRCDPAVLRASEICKVQECEGGAGSNVKRTGGVTKAVTEWLHSVAARVGALEEGSCTARMAAAGTATAGAVWRRQQQQQQQQQQQPEGKRWSAATECIMPAITRDVTLAYTVLCWERRSLPPEELLESLHVSDNSPLRLPGTAGRSYNSTTWAASREMRCAGEDSGASASSLERGAASEAPSPSHPAEKTEALPSDKELAALHQQEKARQDEAEALLLLVRHAMHLLLPNRAWRFEFISWGSLLRFYHEASMERSLRRLYWHRHAALGGPGVFGNDSSAWFGAGGWGFVHATPANFSVLQKQAANAKCAAKATAAPAAAAAAAGAVTVAAAAGVGGGGGVAAAAAAAGAGGEAPQAVQTGAASPESTQTKALAALMECRPLRPVDALVANYCILALLALNASTARLSPGREALVAALSREGFPNAELARAFVTSHERLVSEGVAECQWAAVRSAWLVRARCPRAAVSRLAPDLFRHVLRFMF